jgi:hypothetical protein
MLSTRVTQRKGDIVTAQAIATFTRLGYDVSVPITESAKYDLIVDTPDELRRVQVKYSSGRKVDLRNIHSNASGYVVKKCEPEAYDWLYIFYAGETGCEEYLMPECLAGRNSVSLAPRFRILLEG